MSTEEVRPEWLVCKFKRGKLARLEPTLVGLGYEFILASSPVPGQPRATFMNFCFVSLQGLDLSTVVESLKEPDLKPLIRPLKHHRSIEKNGSDTDIEIIPMVISNEEIQPIRSWLQAVELGEVDTTLSPGDEIEIKMSCFDGRRGKVIEVRNGRVLTEVEMMGRMVPLSIPIADAVLVVGEE